MTIAVLPPSIQAASLVYDQFLDELSMAGFSGEIDRDYAMRTVLSTDNSIYQRLPQAVVFPRNNQDVVLLASLLSRPVFNKIVVAARGGGTGANGQTLTNGVMVDLSRHMNKILEINVEENWVRVQAGVVKDQLNAALKPYGLFFAPELSTSNRATIGGMINTDACGQGSCTYGKTRDHVQAIDFVLLGGDTLRSEPVNATELAELCEREDLIGNIYRTAYKIVTEQEELIKDKFPKINRCLTGYDLAHLQLPDGRFNLNNILCGAEGSLGFIIETKLNILPIPKHSVMVNIRYASFMDALTDAQTLLQHHPLSIETVDSKVLGLAMQDIVWNSVADYFPTQAGTEALGINLVEFSGDDETELNAKVSDFLRNLTEDQTVVRLGHTLAIGHDSIKKIYAMRKQAVGLLGNVKGEARPIPFIEDTAVPPECLPDFIAEFRAILDGYGLEYGMFGHVDAGVLHVRPALDMKKAEHKALVKPLSDAVFALTKKYGGLLWGEHGKGIRSEYVPQFFGVLYPAIQQIKAAFDPYNQLNPGKIATPYGWEGQLLPVDGVSLRGDFDRQIDERVWQSYGAAMHCNGNGACYNFDPDDAMCPSWKATRNRIHSPKGRASLIREWLRLQELAGVDVLAVAARKPRLIKDFVVKIINSVRNESKQDFSHQVYEAMAGCLACKSCAGQCPVKVNVPDFRSRFLDLYHRRYLRPLRDHAMSMLETVLPLGSRFSRIYNLLMRNKRVQTLTARYFGIADAPLFSGYNFTDLLKTHDVSIAHPKLLQTLTEAERAKSVILVQDAFTRYFDTEIFAALIRLASLMGYKVWLAPYMPNGKPLHVQGFLHRFETTAGRNARKLYALAQYNIPLVGLDPAMTLVYRQEYKHLKNVQVPQVYLPQEWLLKVLPPDCGKADGKTYSLFSHCTEKTNSVKSNNMWQDIFARRGMKLTIETVGCCGMSGTYGHESRNLETSRVIFQQSWQKKIQQAEEQVEILATGYSCRSQVKRMEAGQLRHPVQVLLEDMCNMG